VVWLKQKEVAMMKEKSQEEKKELKKLRDKLKTYKKQLTVAEALAGTNNGQTEKKKKGFFSSLFSKKKKKPQSDGFGAVKGKD
jgi:hypothetical protein